MTTKYSNFKILLLVMLGLTIFYSCNYTQEKTKGRVETKKQTMQLSDFKLKKTLQIGDRIELSGGYDYDPLYLKNPPSTKRSGVVLKFIKGQNDEPAAVVKLDEKISGQKISGDIVILELRNIGQTWLQPSPVHIELCDFFPEDKAWKDRRQGEWVEAAATVTVVQLQK